jgi:hypothetical protein
MKILVACEESQAVTVELRKLGHEAYSCDLMNCSGGHEEWHIKQDVLPLLNGRCSFETCDGINHKIEDRWDMIISFPPCTHLCVSGARHFEQKRKDGRQQQGIDFFMMFANADCQRIAIENPIGIMSNVWRKPNQIIHPWMFGDKFSKSTCLWLKGLPNLEPTNIVEKGEFIEWTDKNGKKKRQAKWFFDALKNAKTPEERAIIRSKTFPGIAKAMAEQWTRNI